MPYFSQSEANELVGLITNTGAELPPSLARYEEIKQELNGAATLAAPQNVLDLTTDELVNYAEKLARHTAAGHNGRNEFGAALSAVLDQAARATQTALTAGEIDAVIISLRPQFDAAAVKLNKAARMGITSTTKAEDILRFPDPDAIETFKELPRDIATMRGIAQFRIRVSELLNVSPTAHEQSQLRGWRVDYNDPVDYSGAFTAGDVYSINGEYNEGSKLNSSSSLDWLALGLADLHLTTPTEAAAKYERALIEKIEVA